MKLKRNDHVMVNGRVFYVSSTDKDGSVRIHPDQDYNGVGYGPYTKDDQREWAVV